jgi:hypothetical protein
MLKDLIKEILKEEIMGKLMGKPEISSTEYPLVGKCVLIRHHKFGVNAGIVESEDSEAYTLKQSRKLWRWAPVSGIALESLAEHGPDPERTKATAVCNNIVIPKNAYWCGTIELSSDIYREIIALKEAEQS